MPSYLRGKERDQTVAVRAYAANRNIFYGFKTKDLTELPQVSTADITALGHIQFDSLPDASLIFFRATSPKPPRCKKTLNRNPGVTQQGSASTFYSVGRERAVIGAGWDLTTGKKSVNLKQKDRYTTAIAEVSNGFLYVFPINTADLNTHGGILGLKRPSEITTEDERSKLIMGASRPRPIKVAKDLGDGKTFSTFASYSSLGQLAANGYSQIKGEILT